MNYFLKNSKNLLYFCLIILFAFFSTYCFSAVKIKGGVITSAEILKTEKPLKRDDLIYDLNKLNFSHLDKKITLEEAIRFENRIGIGAPYNRVKRYLGKTRKEAISIVVSELKNYEDDFNWPKWKNSYIPTNFLDNGLKRNRRDCRVSSFRTDLEFKWSKSILTNSIPQFEKLALLWLDHFSVAFDEYNQTHSFLHHLEFIRRNAIGNFDKFLEESIKNPGIIVYLNNEKSTTQKPNENLAREFLELFSLGEGNYSENEIKNFAKKLSGHSINHISQNFHYYKYKESGQTLSAFGRSFNTSKEFIDLVVDHPAFGEFIAKKFYNEYVDLGEPNTNDLAILVSTFRKNSYNIIKLFEATISLDSFWDERNKLTLVKSPIELIYGSARTLGVQTWKNQSNISWLVFLSKDFGQDLFNPPNIAGWQTGKQWLAGQLLEKRMSKLKNHFSVIKKHKKNNKSSKKSILRPPNMYNKELDIFYNNTAENQLAVETIVINYVPKDFETREWASIDVSFYGVKLNEKFWDGLNIRFGTDINSKKKKNKRLNFIQVKHGFNHPEIFSSWEGSWISSGSGHYEWQSSFPIGPRMQNFNAKSRDEKLLMIRLLQALQHIIENENSSMLLIKNPYAQNWLKERIKQIPIIWNLEDPSIPNTKIFSYISNDNDKNFKTFQCGGKRAEIDFVEVRSVDEMILKSIPSSYNENQNIKLTTLLLPEVDLGLDDEDFLYILSYEGYQLK